MLRGVRMVVAFVVAASSCVLERGAVGGSVAPAGDGGGSSHDAAIARIDSGLADAGPVSMDGALADAAPLDAAPLDAAPLDAAPLDAGVDAGACALGEFRCGAACVASEGLGEPCDGPDGDLCAAGTWACDPSASVRICAEDTERTEICDGLDDDCDGVVDEGRCTSCPGCERLEGDATLVYCDCPVSWPDARRHCTEDGGDLVVMDEAALDRAVTEPVDGDFWIGLRDPDRSGTWSHVDGTRVGVFDGFSFEPEPGAYTNWGPDRPNNLGFIQYCGFSDEETGGWDDDRCGARAAFVCEYP